MLVPQAVSEELQQTERIALYILDDRIFALHYSEGLQLKRVWGTNGRSVFMIRVNLRWELVADGDGILALYCCNLLLLRR